MWEIKKSLNLFGNVFLYKVILWDIQTNTHKQFYTPGKMSRQACTYIATLQNFDGYNRKKFCPSYVNDYCCFSVAVLRLRQSVFELFFGPIFKLFISAEVKILNEAITIRPLPSPTVLRNTRGLLLSPQWNS